MRASSRLFSSATRALRDERRRGNGQQRVTQSLCLVVHSFHFDEVLLLGGLVVDLILQLVSLLLGLSLHSLCGGQLLHKKAQ